MSTLDKTLPYIILPCDILPCDILLKYICTQNRFRMQIKCFFLLSSSFHTHVLIWNHSFRKKSYPVTSYLGTHTKILYLLYNKLKHIKKKKIMSYNFSHLIPISKILTCEKNLTLGHLTLWHCTLWLLMEIYMFIKLFKNADKVLLLVVFIC
jgi:hypothetical protein